MEHQDKVLIVDFGSQYTQLIARRIRQMGVFSIILPCHAKTKDFLAVNPAAVILSGGPSSVYEKKAPKLDEKLLQLNVPVLGICYGMQLLAHVGGGKIEPAQAREYGHAPLVLLKKSKLFSKIKKRVNVWMSHGDHIQVPPEGYVVTAKSENAIASFENEKLARYGLQFHPEVVHSEQGTEILRNFIFRICGLKKNWTMPSFIEEQVKEIREMVGEKKVVLGLSGGVDSTCLALLLHKAIGDQLTCVFVNNGLLRQNEAEKVKETFTQHYNIKLKYVNAEKKFLTALDGVSDPEEKRKIIGKIFVDVFFSSIKHFDFLAQGTLYPDVIESVSTKGPSDAIKTHHNRVPQILELIKKNQVVEPFKELFKDEVRAIGLELGLIEEMIKRHPFPGPGLAIRILGEVTKKRLNALRKADKIVLDEIKSAGYYNELWQAFAVLLPIKSVGVMGDKRTYGHTIALRMVTSVDGMTADFALLPKNILTKISNRIIGEVKEVNRVVLDISSKPPGTIEWE